MIARKDIIDFFDNEAETSKVSWDALMKLSLNDRIRKRKAVKDVFLDKENHGVSPEGETLLKLIVSKNLSDFKEGECLVLHKDGLTSGIKCTINSFEGDGVIMVSVFGLNMPSDLSSYYDTPLVLDKDCVDLRQHVYYNFTAELPHESQFWENVLLNKHKKPLFENLEECEEELDDTIKNFNLNLTDKQREAIMNSMASKDYYLVQGPPGTGKSFVLGLIILEELAYFNHKVVVIGPNHLAINNVLGQVLKLCPGYNPIILKVGQSYNAPSMKCEWDGKEIGIENMQRINGYGVSLKDTPILIGLTPHSLYTSRGRGLEFDTLIIDEAGQMTIPLAMMGLIKAKKVIFAGDHKQLPPIITSDKVGEEMKQSAFKIIMNEENCTMLDVSFRMCEPICNFVSDLFYDGKVRPNVQGTGDKIICNDPMYSFDTPVVLHNVEDDGEQTSEKEAEYISSLVASYIEKGLSAREIAVLTPFRAQAATVRRAIRRNERIPDEKKQKVAVDTVDKMQGQEREVIIFSMTSGNPDYISEMAEFLYNPNKLNVAFSRAKSKLIVVGNLAEISKINYVEYPHIHKMLESKYVTII